METKQKIIDRLKQQGILPLFYHEDEKVCVEVIKALYSAGVRAVEFTNRGESALENFKTLVALRNESMTDLLLAIGTIRTPEQATKFIDAGADFLISPVFDAAVSKIATARKILWIPGCMTPTEIHVAENEGCKLVKLFPGNILTPSFVSGIKELFPAMDFMPTGGVDVNKDNMSEWFKVGVCAVGLGSKVISNTILAQKDYATITNRSKQALDIVASIRK